MCYTISKYGKPSTGQSIKRHGAACASGREIQFVVSEIAVRNYVRIRSCSWSNTYWCSGNCACMAFPARDRFYRGGTITWDFGTLRPIALARASSTTSGLFKKFLVSKRTRRAHAHHVGLAKRRSAEEIKVVRFYRSELFFRYPKPIIPSLEGKNLDSRI